MESLESGAKRLEVSRSLINRPVVGEANVQAAHTSTSAVFNVEIMAPVYARADIALGTRASRLRGRRTPCCCGVYDSISDSQAVLEIGIGSGE